MGKFFYVGHWGELIPEEILKLAYSWRYEAVWFYEHWNWTHADVEDLSVEDFVFDLERMKEIRKAEADSYK